MQVAGVSGGMTADEWNDWQWATSRVWSLFLFFSYVLCRSLPCGSFFLSHVFLKILNQKKIIVYLHFFCILPCAYFPSKKKKL
jgi:hypothetical protein